MHTIKSSNFAPNITYKMKINTTTFVYTLHTFCLIWLLTACGGTAPKEDKKEADNTAKKGEREVENVPTTLDNFDLTYYGMFKGQRTQLNLRKYGSALSGNWWISDTEEVQVTGSLQGQTDNFLLDITSAKGEKVANLKGKLGEDRLIKASWTTEKDSTAVDFIPVAKNVKVYTQLKISEMKSAKKSQNGKREVVITYPQILGMEDEVIAKRINGALDKYFSADSWADSLEKGSRDFKEDVRYTDTYLNNEYVSVCKHHHLDKDNGNLLILDDTHGITVNYKRGKIYELRDVFKPNSLELLNQVVLARINKSANGKLTPEQLEKCKIKGEESTSFSLKKSYMNFHLTERLPNEYKGSGYVQIPYKDLKDFINPSGPLAEHLK